jgi:hypothetical protein
MSSFHLFLSLLLIQQNVILSDNEISGKSTFLKLFFFLHPEYVPVVVKSSHLLNSTPILYYLRTATSFFRDKFSDKIYVLLFDSVDPSHIKVQETIRQIVIYRSLLSPLDFDETTF